MGQCASLLLLVLLCPELAAINTFPELITQSKRRVKQSKRRVKQSKRRVKQEQESRRAEQEQSKQKKQNVDIVGW